MKKRSEGAMIKAYKTLWDRLTSSGTVKPKTHILDNEASTEFKKEIQKNCAIQLVPPDNHRRNLGNTDLQKSLQVGPSGGRRLFPNETMGQTPPTDDTDT
jgi:hypothetical protein